MTIVIITHVPHILSNSTYYAYSPYVREMNIWLKHFSKVIIVAPLHNMEPESIDYPYSHRNIDFRPVNSFDLLSASNVLKTLYRLPVVLWSIFLAMRAADHIHLRCPGNMGLLGVLVQSLFPSKPKTAKYAGNWDLSIQEPITYKFQKHLLQNTYFSKNMSVLVYGIWPRMTSNAIPFFTATYFENEKTIVPAKMLARTICFIFVGSLVEGKNPLYAVKLIEQLQQAGLSVTLNIIGNGPVSSSLQDYIKVNSLDKYVKLLGNKTKDEVKTEYLNAHFVVLPSKSEGWPKAIAEGMFWGCVPVATPVSCVPYMLDYGKRGLLLQMSIQADVFQLLTLIGDSDKYFKMSADSAEWSRHYTMDLFECEIQKLILNENSAIN